MIGKKRSLQGPEMSRARSLIKAMGYTDAIAGSGPALVVRQGHQLVALVGQADRFPRLVRHVPYADGITHDNRGLQPTVLYAEGVRFQSPGSRSAPWVRIPIFSVP